MTSLLHALLLAALVASCATPRPSTSEGPASPPLAHATSFDWTLGEWTGTRRAAASGRSDPMRVNVTPILGGAAQLREMWVETDGGTYRGISIQLREKETGLWTRYYANDVHGRLVTLRATEESDGGPVRWHSGPNENGRWSENHSEHPAQDTWISTVSRTTDGGKTWQVLFVDELERSPD